MLIFSQSFAKNHIMLGPDEEFNNFHIYTIRHGFLQRADGKHIYLVKQFFNLSLCTYNSRTNKYTPRGDT